MSNHKVQNIIFDLGGVIIDLDTEKTFQAFQKVIPSRSRPGRVEEVELFLEYEKGLISSSEFRDGIRKLASNESLDDQKIDNIWNSMLLRIPKARLELMQRLAPKYRLFVLSNTNEIHVTAFNEIVRQTLGKPTINHFFEKVYYSHEINLRKPEREIYEYVLADSQLVPEQTLFVDDKEENILAAQKVNLQTFHVTKQQDILSYFKD
ncbi:MAG: HAD family hydrolase [Cyclobacteriaceae bacterium]